jgi:hypothetical protein
VTYIQPPRNLGNSPVSAEECRASLYIISIITVKLEGVLHKPEPRSVMPVPNSALRLQQREKICVAGCKFKNAVFSQFLIQVYFLTSKQENCYIGNKSD